MSVVKINAIEVPEGMGPELEKRFAARAHVVESMPGFESFELLRPVAGETRYFVYTRWADEASFQAWIGSEGFRHGHAQSGGGQPAGGHPGGGHPGGGHGDGHPGGEAPRPVGAGATLLEFEVVEMLAPES